jgi:catechol 2,3-dioxygenase-like lactoylglutathione lyase family enzyme
MIGYVTIGALDGEASGRFYDAVFGALGGERKSEGGGWLGYGVISEDKSMYACHTAVTSATANGEPACAGNGIMVAYQAPSAEAVAAAYAAGMANGGACEGPPGFRPPEATSGFYAAYLRDPTGNKLCVFTAS